MAEDETAEFESTEIETLDVTNRRYWRRTDMPRPWWPWGIVPMLALILLFLVGAVFIAPRIEADVRDRVADRIGAVGSVDADVASDGQGVAILTSTPVDQWTQLHAIAKTTQCKTWAGQLTCPTTVDLKLREPVAQPAAQQSRPHRFVFARIDDAITLSGEVPDLAEHDRILEAASGRFGEIVNELTISNEAATEQYAPAADAALAVASHLTRGQASWSGTTLSVDGIAASGEVGQARAQFSALGGDSVLSQFNVRAMDERQDCKNGFAQILSQTTVRFETGSAQISEGNEELFASLVDLARSCPGNLTIAGHTDSQGDADMNQSLSLARASAVRNTLIQAGIDTERLTARGFGESQPIADNATADGRAQNRRIVITIDELNN